MNSVAFNEYLKYAQSQNDAVDAVAGLSTLAILAIALFLCKCPQKAAPPIGMLVRTGIKKIERTTGDLPYTNEEMTRDLFLGGLDGLMMLVSGGASGQVGKKIAGKLGVKALSESAAGTATKTGESIIVAALKNPTGYKYVGGNFAKRFLCYSAEFMIDGGLTNAVEGGAEHLLDNKTIDGLGERMLTDGAIGTVGGFIFGWAGKGLLEGTKGTYKLTKNSYRKLYKLKDLKADIPSIKIKPEMLGFNGKIDTPNAKAHVDTPNAKTNFDINAPKNNLDINTPKNKLDIDTPTVKTEKLGLNIQEKADRLFYDGAELIIPPKNATPLEKAQYAYILLSDGKYMSTMNSSKKIRMKNYKLIESLTSIKDKAAFVEFYKKIHKGFPNLEKVSENMLKEWNEAVEKAAKEANVNLLFQGIDPHSSLMLKKALPGSDPDKCLIIIDIPNNDSIDRELLFKNYFTKFMDQRKVSLYHDVTFPNVYTMDEIEFYLDNCDNLTKQLFEINPNARNIYKELKTLAITNPIEVGKFNMDLAKLIQSETEREQIKNFAFAIETFLNSETFKHPEKFQLTAAQKKLINICKKSDFCKYTNVSMMENLDAAMKINGPKQKIKNRQDIIENFDKWDTEKQFALIVEMIKYASEDHNYRSVIYPYLINVENLGDKFKNFVEKLQNPDD